MNVPSKLDICNFGNFAFCCFSPYSLYSSSAYLPISVQSSSIVQYLSFSFSLTLLRLFFSSSSSPGLLHFVSFLMKSLISSIISPNVCIFSHFHAFHSLSFIISAPSVNLSDVIVAVRWKNSFQLLFSSNLSLIVAPLGFPKLYISRLTGPDFSQTNFVLDPSHICYVYLFECKLSISQVYF